MVKRPSDAPARASVESPPSKKVKNKPETTISSPPSTKSGAATTRAAATRTQEAADKELSGTESTGPTTPQEWEKSEDESQLGPMVTQGLDGSASSPGAAIDDTDPEPVRNATAGPTPRPTHNTASVPATLPLAPNGADASTATTTTSAEASATTTTSSAATGGEAGHTQDATPATPQMPAHEVAIGLTTNIPPDLTSINPSLEDVKSLFRNIDYVPAGDQRRMLDFARKNDHANLRYAISQVPLNAQWGTTTQTGKLLCVDDKPITVWAVGDVQTTWFRDLQGNPHDRVNIGFKLPFVFDNEGLGRLYARARPARSTDEFVYAGRRMVIYRKGESMPTVLPFNNVFDARKRFQAKSQMPRLEPSVVGKRDIVLVEGKFTRWNAAKDKRNKREWKLWGVGFELEAVSLLYEAPQDLDPTATDEVPDIDDDM